MFTDAPVQLQHLSCSFTGEQKGKVALLFGEGTKKPMTEAVLAASVKSGINAKYKTAIFITNPGMRVSPHSFGSSVQNCLVIQVLIPTAC